MSSAVRYLTSCRFLWIFGIAGCAGLAMSFLLFHATADRVVTADNNVLGDDFLPFYMAGTLILQGQGRQLYDQRTQCETQDAIIGRFGESRASYAPYVNPASLAVAYSLLARLPYLTAFYLHTAIMAVCLLGGVWVLRRELRHLGTGWIPGAMLGLAFTPMTKAVMGAQNTALTFALMALAYRGVVRRQPGLTGLALGLLMYKPQFAPPFLGLLLLRRQWMTVRVASLVGLGHYLLGALFCGWDWPLDLVSQLTSYYNAAELVANGHTHISIVVALDYWMAGPLADAGVATWITGGLKLCGQALVVAIIVYLIWRWRDADPRRDDFALYWSAAVAATLSISPHTQFHDAGLLLLPALLTINYQLGRGRPPSDAQRLLLLLGYVGGASYYAARAIHFQPLVLWPPLVLLWADHLIRERAARTLAVDPTCAGRG